MRERIGTSVRALASPVAVVSLVLLVLEDDHLLKQAWPGVVTGKLSDVAGLVVAPLLLTVGLAAVGLRQPCTWACALTASWLHRRQGEHRCRGRGQRVVEPDRLPDGDARRPDRPAGRSRRCRWRGWCTAGSGRQRPVDWRRMVTTGSTGARAGPDSAWSPRRRPPVRSSTAWSRCGSPAAPGPRRQRVSINAWWSNATATPRSRWMATESSPRCRRPDSSRLDVPYGGSNARLRRQPDPAGGSANAGRAARGGRRPTTAKNLGRPSSP